MAFKDLGVLAVHGGDQHAVGPSGTLRRGAVRSTVRVADAG
jgi:hypothetical protein